MNKKFLGVVLTAGLVSVLGLAACGQSAAAPADAPKEEATEQEKVEPAEEVEAEPTVAEENAVDGAAYGYAGSDPVELAAYRHLVEEVGKNYEAADASIPVVQILDVDATDPENLVVYGDFWLYNYNIEGDTLECVSGGNYPGVMHMTKDGEGYVVSSFDVVADGANFDESAKELFGATYDRFVEVSSDDAAHDELRKASVASYVSLNNLEVTQFQDYGWDPIALD